MRVIFVWKQKSATCSSSWNDKILLCLPSKCESQTYICGVVLHIFVRII